MADDLQSVTDHHVEGFGRVHEFDREFHRFALPRRIAFCIAETQVIALRPFLVSGIIGQLRPASPGRH